MSKPKRQQLRLHQQANNLEIDDTEDDDTELDDLDFHIGRKSPELVDDELSPYIIDRLALAREKAMERYRELWT